jgi:hypothetical protein
MLWEGERKDDEEGGVGGGMEKKEREGVGWWSAEEAGEEYCRAVCFSPAWRPADKAQGEGGWRYFWDPIQSTSSF